MENKAWLGERVRELEAGNNILEVRGAAMFIMIHVTIN